MGLIIKIKNIQSPNNFKLFYKEGRTPGSSSDQSSNSWGTQYGGVYSSSTTEISIDLIDNSIDLNPFGKQYWFKILDVVTESFIIENIYIHEKEFYDSICKDCTFEGGSAIVFVNCTFEGGSAIKNASPTPTPTLTPTITPVPDCSFINGSASK